MTSTKQVQANRENAKLSTGPRTEEGKRRTSRNAIKHGFRAKEPLIPGEDPEEFAEHNAELILELGAIGFVEEKLVEQLVDITWRLKRFGRIEAAIINDLFDKAAEQEENQDKDGEQLLGNALADSHALNRLSRYEAQLARRYHNAMKELREVQKRRRQKRAFSALASALETATTETDHTAGSERTDPYGRKSFGINHEDGQGHRRRLLRSRPTTADRHQPAPGPPGKRRRTGQQGGRRLAKTPHPSHELPHPQPPCARGVPTSHRASDASPTSRAARRGKPEPEATQARQSWSAPRAQSKPVRPIQSTHPTSSEPHPEGCADQLANHQRPKQGSQARSQPEVSTRPGALRLGERTKRNQPSPFQRAYPQTIPRYKLQPPNSNLTSRATVYDVCARQSFNSAKSTSPVRSSQ